MWSINVYLSLLETNVEFLWWGGVGGGAQSDFRIQPNYSVEVVLCCVVIGAVSKIIYQWTNSHFGVDRVNDLSCYRKNSSSSNLIILKFV